MNNTIIINKTKFYEIPAMLVCKATGNKTEAHSIIIDKYMISPKGDLYDKEFKSVVGWAINPKGYAFLLLNDNDGKSRMVSRHRLLCHVFKPVPNSENLLVDHVNGIKGDDRLDNLEWVTPRENIIRAGKMNLTTKCLPIETMHIDTGEVIKYDSIVACANANNVSKDFVNYRVSQGEHRVFPERLRYRYGHSDSQWSACDIYTELLKYGTHNGIIAKNIITNEQKEFSSQRELSKFINLAESTICVILKKYEFHPVLPGYWQIKFAWDNREWTTVDDPHTSIIGNGCSKPVQVVDTITGQTHIYASAMVACKQHHIKPTAMNYRLKSRGKIVFKDNCRYGYYPYSVELLSPIS